MRRSAMRNTGCRDVDSSLGLTEGRLPTRRWTPRRRPRGRSITLAVGVCVLAGGFLTPAAEAAANRVSCGAVVTASTTLRGDLVNCPGSGLVIGADNITVDLAGHTVDGLGSLAPFGSTGIDDSGGYDGVIVKNGTVREFQDGVVLVGTTGGVVRGLRVSNNGSHGLLVDGFAAADSTDNLLAD